MKQSRSTLVFTLFTLISSSISNGMLKGKNQGLDLGVISGLGIVNDAAKMVPKNPCPKSDPHPVATNDFNGFNEMMEALQGYQCPDSAEKKKKIQEQALNLMDNALYHIYEQKAASPSSKQSFEDKMVQKWDLLLTHFEKHSTEVDPLWKDPSKDSLSRKSTLHLVESALESGIIPLPTIREKTDDGKSLFGYSSMSRQFFLGVAPVSLVPRTPADLVKIQAHPFLPSFTRSMVHFMDHDLQHAQLIGFNFDELNLTDPQECKKFRACFEELANKKIDPRMLFFLLHEVSFPAVDLAGLFEYSLEASLEKFPLANLLGKNLEEKKLSCQEVKTFAASVREIDDAYESLPKGARLVSKRRTTEQNEMIEKFEEQKIALQKKFDFMEVLLAPGYQKRSGKRPLPDTMKNLFPIFEKLHRICLAEFSDESLGSRTEGFPYLSTQLKTRVSDLSKDLHEKYLKNLNTIKEVQNQFQNGKCSSYRLQVF